MPRYEPDFRWQVDWGNDDYAHAAADVTGDLASYGLQFGAALLPSRGYHPSPANGTLTLKNRDGFYNPDTVGGLGAVLDKPHLCRRTEGTTTLWEGYAFPTDLRAIQEDGRSVWELRSREHIAHDVEVSFLVEDGDPSVIAAEITTQSQTTISAPTTPACGVGWVSQQRAIASVVRLCQWAGLIAFETSNGSLTLKNLATMAAGIDPGIDFTFSYQPQDPPIAAYPVAAVRNYGRFESRVAYVEADEVELGRIAADLPTGQEVYFTIPYSSSPDAPRLSDFTATPSQGTVTQIPVDAFDPSLAEFFYIP